jgi:cytochrome P450
LYNLFLHPLHKFPGPLTAGATGLWKTSRSLRGTIVHDVKKLHDQYGPVVRIAPDELSFIDSRAWKDIYGHHGSYEMEKDPKFYNMTGNLVDRSILNADRNLHGFLRRQLSHGFSERSMRDQAPLIMDYLDLLISQLERVSKGNKPVNMVAWLNYATFDIIGNLGFGSDFGCLKKGEYHPWVKAIGGGLKANAILRVIIRSVPESIVVMLDKIGVFEARKKHVAYSNQKIQERLAVRAERPDLLEGLIKKKDELTLGQLSVNAAALTVAGSETTASLLSGVFYLVGSNPEILTKLTQEVRSTFKNEEEITMTSVNTLEFMLACLDETMRVYPAVAIGMPRVVPKGGHEIAGQFIPENTVVAVWPLAANHSALNFTKPDKFHPRRYMGDEEFASDDFSAAQPFGTGPRNCIGRNLAYAEMRLIVARILFKFDVKLGPGAKDWIERQRIYTTWQKPELPVYLTPAK